MQIQSDEYERKRKKKRNQYNLFSPLFIMTFKLKKKKRNQSMSAFFFKKKKFYIQKDQRIRCVIVSSIENYI